MNNNKPIDALHKLPLPSSLYFGICGETKKLFSFKPSTGNFVPVSRCQKHDIGCKNIELIHNHQSSKGVCRTGSYHHEMCK